MDCDEFQESDIMFSEYSSDQSMDSSDSDNGPQKRPNYNNQSSNGSMKNMMMKRRKNIPKMHRRVSSSAPMNIPLGNNSFRYDDDDDVECSELFDEECSDDNEDQWSRLPPHLIVERRVNGEMARSFSPLKGRNMCQVRNSILRMTGFLER